jgi:hypothetical protein
VGSVHGRPGGLQGARRRAVDRITAAVPNDAHLTAMEQSVARADLTTLRVGLNDLKTKVDAETAVAAVRADTRAARGAVTTNPAFEQGALLVKAAVANRYLDAVSNRIGRAQTRIDAAKQAVCQLLGASTGQL